MVKLILLSDYNYDMSKVQHAINSEGTPTEIQITEAGSVKNMTHYNLQATKSPKQSANTDYSYSLPVVESERKDLLFTVTYLDPQLDAINEVGNTTDDSKVNKCIYTDRCEYNCDETETKGCERYDYYLKADLCQEV